MKTKLNRSRGKFWSVRFSTGELSNGAFRNRADATRHARLTNEHSERVSGECVVRALVRFDDWIAVQEYPVR